MVFFCEETQTKRMFALISTHAKFTVTTTTIRLLGDTHNRVRRVRGRGDSRREADDAPQELEELHRLRRRRAGRQIRHD